MPPTPVTSKRSNPEIKIRGVTVHRPIVYGNVTVRLTPEERLEGNPDHTHRWTVAVRGVTDDEDLSYFIKKVVFKLHDTYEMPSRSIESAPFEVTETGWGEFDIVIKIFFVPEANEKPITINHHLKLHPWNAAPGAVLPEVGSEGDLAPKVDDAPVSSWLYDEIVFVEPNEALYTLLLENQPRPLPATKEDAAFSAELEREEAQRLTAAYNEVARKSEELRNSLVQGEADLARIKNDIERLTVPPAT